MALPYLIADLPMGTGYNLTQGDVSADLQLLAIQVVETFNPYAAMFGNISETKPTKYITDPLRRMSTALALGRPFLVSDSYDMFDKIQPHINSILHDRSPWADLARQLEVDSFGEILQLLSQLTITSPKDGPALGLKIAARLLLLMLDYGFGEDAENTENTLTYLMYYLATLNRGL